MTMVRYDFPNRLEEDGWRVRSVCSKLLELPQPLLERVVELAIEKLDAESCDPDLEPDGDEEDGTNAEDEVAFSSTKRTMTYQIGCSISDPG